MKGIYQRSLTGLVYVSLIIGGLLFGWISYLILFICFLLLSVQEYIRVYAKEASSTWKSMHLIGSLLIFIAGFLDAANIVAIPSVLIISILFIAIHVLGLFEKSNEVINKSGNQFNIFFYITVPFYLSNYLVFTEGGPTQYNPNLLLFIFILLWSNDTGAYLAGSSFGKHLFFKRISPKKTWEGVLGGIILTVVVAIFISKYEDSNLSLINWVTISLLVGIFGTLGDLVESLLKRNANIKDFGNIFPGHGGILDRLDSFLLAVTAIFVYLNIVIFI